MEHLSDRSMQNIRVLKAHESQVSCKSLKDSLERVCKQISVATCAADRVELMGVLATSAIDIALIDESLADNTETESRTLQTIHGRFPQTKMVALLKQSDAASVVSAFRSGVRGVFHRSETVEELCKCIHAVDEGQIWASSQDLQRIVEALGLHDAGKRKPGRRGP